MTTITLETIQARQDEMVAMLAAFNAAKTIIKVPATTIELRPGEQYAGLVLKDDGTPSHHLVRMAKQPPIRLSWQDAKDWASKMDGGLPTRCEMSLIYAHCRAHVEPEWHWSGEAFEADTASAWSCHLGDGFQSTHLKWYENDAIAVRRIPIGGRDECGGSGLELTDRRLHT